MTHQQLPGKIFLIVSGPLTYLHNVSRTLRLVCISWKQSQSSCRSLKNSAVTLSLWLVQLATRKVLPARQLLLLLFRILKVNAAWNCTSSLQPVTQITTIMTQLIHSFCEWNLSPNVTEQEALRCQFKGRQSWYESRSFCIHQAETSLSQKFGWFRKLERT